MARKKIHYVDNKKFYGEMIEYEKMIRENQAVGDENPPITEYMGKCFWDIAVGLSNKPNFINYTYKDEMIMDGIENCIRYCHNFDPEKSKNPFAYFTQIIYYAFLRRIEKEKKQTYIKFKMTENVWVNEELVTLESGERIDVKLYDNFRDVIDDFETKMKNKKKPITKTENSKNKKYALDDFMD